MILIALLIILVVYVFLLDTANVFSKKTYNNPQISRPDVIVQTYHTKEKIPQKVYDNIKKYAPGYEHRIYNDSECHAFILEHFGTRVADKFNDLKVKAHKADLFRYCYLYQNGGVYMDIKTELIKPIDEIFGKDKLYSVFSICTGTIYNGIVSSGPKNELLLELINYIVETPDPGKLDYLYICRHFYTSLSSYCDHKLKLGENDNNVYLYEEVVKAFNLFTLHGYNDKNVKYQYVEKCHDGLDRYGICSYVYDKGVPIIKTRYSDYPW